MKNYTFDDIYYTLLGEQEGPYAVPGVENIYAPGRECDRLYAGIIAARERLQARLGTPDEDADLELILGNFLSIQRIVCEEIFRCGQRYCQHGA